MCGHFFRKYLRRDDVKEGVTPPEIIDDRVLAILTGSQGDSKRVLRIFLYHEKVLPDLRGRSHRGFGEDRGHELTED